jgi:alpha-N-acetylglucosamine transferase
LLVAVTDNIISQVKPYLEKENILYRVIPYMEYSKEIKETFANTHILNIASKFALFKFTDYDKLVYIDSDVLIYHNIDELFLYPDGAMYDDNGNPFIGLFSFIPRNHNADFYYILS